MPLQALISPSPRSVVRERAALFVGAAVGLGSGIPMFVVGSRATSEGARPSLSLGPGSAQVRVAF